MNRAAVYVRRLAPSQKGSRMSTWHPRAFWYSIPMLILFLAITMYWLVSPGTFEERIDALTVIGTAIAATALVGNLINTTRTLDHQRTSQRDERFFRASEQLGAESEAARIGALFSLERLSKESDDYYDVVIEVICSFVRKRSDEIRPSKQELESLDSEVLDMARSGARNIRELVEKHVTLPKTSHDITAAMAILKRRARRFGVDEDRGLDLTGANLCGLSFRNADFQGCNLERALLINTHFHSCNLAHARLSRGDIRFGGMGSTLLNHANFEFVKANHAFFYYAANVPNPSNKVAQPITVDGETQWKVRSSVGIEEKVNGGRYLDDSYWLEATMDGSDFQCSDLSGMRGLMPGQYESFTKFQEVKSPTFNFMEVVIPWNFVSSNSSLEEMANGFQIVNAKEEDGH